MTTVTILLKIILYSMSEASSALFKLIDNSRSLTSLEFDLYNNW